MEHLGHNIFVIRNFFDKNNIFVSNIEKDRNLFQERNNDCIKTYAPLEDSSNLDYLLAIKEYNNLTHSTMQKVFNSSLKKHSSLACMVYGIGCYINYHTDQPERYTYSSVFFINGSYSGGELVFPDQSIEIETEENIFIMFPSAYSHGTKPVTQGEKISSTCFWELK